MGGLALSLLLCVVVPLGMLTVRFADPTSMVGGGTATAIGMAMSYWVDSGPT